MRVQLYYTLRGPLRDAFIHLIHWKSHFIRAPPRPRHCVRAPPRPRFLRSCPPRPRFLHRACCIAPKFSDSTKKHPTTLCSSWSKDHNTGLEEAVLLELGKARQQPSKYGDVLGKPLASFEKKNYFSMWREVAITKEGPVRRSRMLSPS
jgi:hypothetical protein